MVLVLPPVVLLGMVVSLTVLLYMKALELMTCSSRGMGGGQVRSGAEQGDIQYAQPILKRVHADVSLRTAAQPPPASQLGGYQLPAYLVAVGTAGSHNGLEVPVSGALQIGGLEGPHVANVATQTSGLSRIQLVLESLVRMLQGRNTILLNSRA